jgi:hypothetical protein
VKDVSVAQEPYQSVEQDDLDSLTQTARLKRLNTARCTLIGIGLLTIIINGYSLVMT